MGKPVIAGALLVVLASAAIVGLAMAGPSDEGLSTDLAQVRQDIVDASAEAYRYGEGLLRSLILLRTEILKNTEAMLDQKQRSLLRGIRLDYRIDGIPLLPLPPEELAKIQADLDALDEQIATAEAEAAPYRGGLIQGLALSALATHQLTRAMLVQRLYLAKHGIPWPHVPGFEEDREPKSPPGKVVEDADAL